MKNRESPLQTGFLYLGLDRMEGFSQFHNQEKELRGLFDAQKETESQEKPEIC